MVDDQIRFETLIERYHDEIYRYIWRLLDNSSSDRAIMAEDVTQDVFMRAYTAFDRLHQGSNYRAWLYKIATNCTYTVLKRKRPENLEDDPVSEQDRAQDEAFILKETIEHVANQIQCLPPKQRSTVIMRYVQGLEYSDIATILDCSPETARANVSHGIRRLRHLLEQERNG